MHYAVCLRIVALPCACGDAHAFCEPGVPSGVLLLYDWIAKIKQMPESLAARCQRPVTLQLAAFIVVSINQPKCWSKATDCVDFHIASKYIHGTAD